MKDEKYTEAGRMLLRFLHQEAKSKGITQEEIAKRTGFQSGNVSRMLNYKYSPTIENFLRLANSIEVRLELHSDSDFTFKPTHNIDTPKFLLVPDAANAQLYILHTKQPACLVKVIQTIPAQFIITDLFEEELTPETEIELIEAAKTFYKYYAENIDTN